ncbi:hypothetical protein M413DRAFT_189785 [Hebeloma cylindrosporum]|uniref:Uncharacterized protein n=1 Tax=Hebeloma cylindrosporum TaxID=76867 RepID=A0A0C3C8S2_HEBCY|nr:hypothetical protein M413DRAFT_189785 [Hebeloma cylindrosporum h7]
MAQNIIDGNRQDAKMKTRSRKWKHTTPKTRVRMRQIRKGCYVPTLAFIGYIRYNLLTMEPGWCHPRNTWPMGFSLEKVHRRRDLLAPGACKSRSASSSTLKVDWIMIAPSRRDLAKGRTVLGANRFGRPGGLELASI